MGRSLKLVLLIALKVYLLSYSDAFSTYVCGSSLMTASIFTKPFYSPGYFSGNYPSNITCGYTIRASASNKVLLINVTQSILEPSISCSADHVSVYDGLTTSYPHLLTWCGSTTPAFNSSGQYITLVFQTNGQYNYKGFRLLFREHIPAAGYIGQSITTTPATVYNPNSICGPRRLTVYRTYTYLDSPGDSPYLYPRNLNCWYTIEAYYTYYKIRVEVLKFALSDLCQNDYVKIYDGSSSSSRLLQTWCKTNASVVESSGRYLTLEFRTDHNANFGGFRLRFMATRESLTTTTRSPLECEDEQHIADSSYQYLTSPGYPNHNYASNQRCEFHITASASNEKVKVDVLDSQLEGSGCKYDNVKAYDGSILLSTWCSNSTPTIISSGRHLTLVFTTDGSGNYKGFRLRYIAVTCGGLLSATSSAKYLTSPNYPLQYPNFADCTWIITADDRRNIQIQIITMVTSTSNCYYDYLQIRDGSLSTSTLLDAVCGSDTGTYISIGNTVRLTFHSDGSGTAKGFRLRYKSGHFTRGDTELLVTETHKFIYSPEYLGLYPSDSHVSWTLHTGDSEHVVYIRVLHSHLEFDCSDYVEAFDGRNKNAPSLGRWCGTDAPTKQSSGQYMFIEFFSDSSQQYSGFGIVYYSKPNSQTNMGAIIGGVIGSLTFCGFVLGILLHRKRHYSFEHRTRSSRARNTNTNRNVRQQPSQAYSAGIPQTNGAYQPDDSPLGYSASATPYLPPPYSSVQATQEGSTQISTISDFSSPPSYNDVIKDGALYKVNTGSA